MKLLFLDHLISAEVLQAICRTLLHSLWQGLVMAVLTGLILVLTRKASARLRYNILTALFILFLAGAGFTLIQQLRVAEHSILTNAFTLSPATLQPAATATGTPEVQFPQTYIGSLLAFCNRHAVLIVSAWFIILLFKTVRLGMGIAYMQRIRYQHTRPVAAEWKEKLSVLAARLQVKPIVTLLESPLVKVPVVVGFLKPIILTPLGMLTNLPPDQVEHILLHELAHIRRRDYLVNLLQSFAEVIFFFNPAVIWLSSLIREDRENCCDDLAISGTSSKMNYVNTLVSFQEYHLNIPAGAALGFAGSKYPLLDRIRRIINNNNKNLNFMERIFLLISIVVITGLVLLPKSVLRAQQTPAIQTITVDRLMTTDNGTKRTRLVEARDSKGARYKIVSVDKVITEFYVDDKQVPVEKAFEYKEIIRQIDEQLAREQKLEEQQAKQKAEKDARDWQQAKEEGERDALRQKQYEETLNKIAKDIVQDKLSTSAGQLSSFSLGRGEFIINGQKQSFDTYNKYKTRYIKTSEEYYRYNSQ